MKEITTNELKCMERYERQIILSQVGTEGQKKLQSASVLIVGAGGLGCPAALYLAGAGIGTIGILDADTVSLTNLHRQVLHTETGVGMNKAESAAEGLKRLNSSVNVKTYPYFLTALNAEEIIKDYDFVIDAVDNFETKFLINDTCVLLKKPFCHAGILQFHGQVLTYVPGQGPCYRCIFEEMPEDVPNCSQAGVIGAIAGIAGCVQALEAVKYFTGAGELLTGRMFIIDGLTMQSRIAPFRHANPSCRVCSDMADIKDIYRNRKAYERK